MGHECPLCDTPDAAHHYADAGREYRRCDTCALVFLRPDQRPDASAESARYRLHENELDDPGYLQHLRQLADPMSARLRAGARGLDFGCGPSLALAEIFRARGFPTLSYDPLFHPESSVLEEAYDFITCSEVLEHVHAPAQLFARLDRLLRPGGVLGVMTRLTDDVTFGTWWYRRDVTHVCFYAAATMDWIGRQHGWRPEVQPPNITLFHKP